jgi:hypothetical protein
MCCHHVTTVHPSYIFLGTQDLVADVSAHQSLTQLMENEGDLLLHLMPAATEGPNEANVMPHGLEMSKDGMQDFLSSCHYVWALRYPRPC